MQLPHKEQKTYTNDSLGWLKNGVAIDNSEDRKSIQGFGAALLVTSDPDWQKKWETKSDTVPQFNEVKKMRTGDKATILIFFSNPLTDKESEVDVTCDIKVLRPNGKNSVYTGLKAMKGRLPGKATYTYLAEPVIAFVGGEQDPLRNSRGDCPRPKSKGQSTTQSSVHAGGKVSLASGGRRLC